MDVQRQPPIDRVAPVTIDNSDYVFASAYDAALGRRDSVEARRIGTEYVAYMEHVFAFYEAQSTTMRSQSPEAANSATSCRPSTS